MFDRLEQVDLPTVGEHDVLVQILAAPINPSDINMIQGISIVFSCLSACFASFRFISLRLH